MTGKPQWFVIELEPTDTILHGPFNTSIRAEGYAMQECRWPFQLKMLQAPSLRALDLTHAFQGERRHVGHA